MFKRILSLFLIAAIADDEEERVGIIAEEVSKKQRGNFQIFYE